VFVNEHGEPLRCGNFNPTIGWRAACEQIGVPDLHQHDLMTRMGHAPPPHCRADLPAQQSGGRRVDRNGDRRAVERAKIADGSERRGAVEGPRSPQWAVVEPGNRLKPGSDQGS
jgi:hypothetical protein